MKLFDLDSVDADELYLGGEARRARETEKAAARRKVLNAAYIEALERERAGVVALISALNATADKLRAEADAACGDELRALTCHAHAAETEARIAGEADRVAHISDLIKRAKRRSSPDGVA